MMQAYALDFRAFCHGEPDSMVQLHWFWFRSQNFCSFPRPSCQYFLPIFPSFSSPCLFPLLPQIQLGIPVERIYDVRKFLSGMPTRFYAFSAL